MKWNISWNVFQIVSKMYQKLILKYFKRNYDYFKIDIIILNRV